MIQGGFIDKLKAIMKDSKRNSNVHYRIKGEIYLWAKNGMLNMSGALAL